MLSKVARSLKNSFGNIIEWYDFSLYGYFATVISSQFFPSTSPLAALIATFGAFAAGFVARPIGSVLFGRLGDKMGRHYAMNMAILFMALATIFMAFLPDYGIVGIWAPILLVAVRLVQGLSAGGQFGNLLTITTEDEEQSYTGFSLGVAYATSVVGFLIASGVSYLTLALVPDSWDWFAWRIPFGLSIILLALQLVFKETDHRDETEDAEAVRTPMKQLFKFYPTRLTLIVWLATMSMVLYYLDITYMVTYMQNQLNLGIIAALAINTFSVSIMILFIPLAGYISDIVGRKTCLVTAFAVMFVISVPMVLGLQLQSIALITFIECVLAIMTATIQGVATPYYTEIFPPQVRASGCSIGFGFGASLSGFAPMIAAAVMGWLNPTNGLIILLLAVSSIGFILATVIPNDKIEIRRKQSTGKLPSGGDVEVH